MADMMDDLNRLKTKTAHSSAPVDTPFNTGMRNEMGLDRDCCAPVIDWEARENQYRKSRDWRGFVEDGKITPKGK